MVLIFKLYSVNNGMINDAVSSSAYLAPEYQVFIKLRVDFEIDTENEVLIFSTSVINTDDQLSSISAEHKVTYERDEPFSVGSYPEEIVSSETELAFQTIGSINREGVDKNQMKELSLPQIAELLDEGAIITVEWVPFVRN
jgi:hypothetical protein